MSRTELHHTLGAFPLTLTAYAKSGRVLMRSTALREGDVVEFPKDIRKRIARTETLDANGVVIDTWTAPWPVDP